MLQQIEALLDNQGAPSPSAGDPKTGHCWLTLGVVFGWTLGGCACGLRCPVNPSSLGWGRSFAEDFFRRGLSSRAALCGTRSFGEPLCATGLLSRAWRRRWRRKKRRGGQSRRPQLLDRWPKDWPLLTHTWCCLWVDIGGGVPVVSGVPSISRPSAGTVPAASLFA